MIQLDALDGVYSVCRLPAQDPIPDWMRGGFVSASRTPDELSIVASTDDVPADVTAEHDFRLLRVRGPIPFETIGVLAKLTAALAEASVSVFAISTFDTDYLLIRSFEIEKAIAALRAAEYTVNAD